MSWISECLNCISDAGEYAYHKLQFMPFTILFKCQRTLSKTFQERVCLPICDLKLKYLPVILWELLSSFSRLLFCPLDSISFPCCAFWFSGLRNSFRYNVHVVFLCWYICWNGNGKCKNINIPRKSWCMPFRNMYTASTTRVSGNAFLMRGSWYGG